MTAANAALLIACGVVIVTTGISIGRVLPSLAKTFKERAERRRNNLPTKDETVVAVLGVAIIAVLAGLAVGAIVLAVRAGG